MPDRTRHRRVAAAASKERIWTFHLSAKEGLCRRHQHAGGQIEGLAPAVIGYLVKGTGNFLLELVFIECALIVSADFYASLAPVLRRCREPALRPGIA